MIIGYNEKVNRIIIYDIYGKKSTKKLSVYGLNILGNNRYTYYDIKNNLHILNMNYIKELKLYNNNNYITTLYN